MPLSMRAALAALFIWAAFHFCCCLFPSVTSKPRHRTYFVYFEGNRRPYLSLLVMASITISATATVIAGGYGAMSPDGAPITNPVIWGWVIPIWGWVIPGIWMIALLSIAVNLWLQIPGGTGKPHSATGLVHRIRRRLWSKKERIWLSLAWFTAGSLFVYVAFYLSTESAQVVATRIPAYWRSMHMTNGVSPVVPLLALCGGVYLWIWFSLQGLALLGQDRPYLPPEDSMEFLLPRSVLGETWMKVDWLRMFSQEFAGNPVEEWCGPFARGPMFTAVLLFITLGALTIFLVAAEELPLRSLGARAFAIMMCFVLDGLMAVMLANAWQLLNIWMRLRKLLIHLDRLPLRRSFAAFQGISWGSVWTLSGNVFDMRYKLVTHEMRCITHLKNSLAEDSQSNWLFDLQGLEEQWARAFEEFGEAQMQFANWYSRVYDQPKNRDQEKLRGFQKVLARFAGLLIARMLLPHWRQEMGSRFETDHTNEERSKPGAGLEELTPVSNLPPYVRHAEAFVCFAFRAYIQNIMGRMRSLVMGMLWLYIAAIFALASYPFDPRPAISGVMLLLLGALGASVVYVYAQMHRDPILSLMTNTTPGELGADFWLKVIGFGAGPVLGLVTMLFPQLTDFVFSWVQPGINSIK